MTIAFDPGYVKRPWTTLVGSYPDETVYPPADFRVEWGPIFHRGRLDGTARVLVIGQDPAQHETICRRILVGEAGQRFQGFLSKLGITTSYTMINTFLYSVYGSGGAKHVHDSAITAYRNRWIDAAVNQPLDAVITLGQLANDAFAHWKSTATGTASTVAAFNVVHPTYPDSASHGNQPGHPTKAEAMKKLCDNWNVALNQLHPIVAADQPVPLVLYGDTITDAEHTQIPQEDLPAGLPPWMRSLKAWATRSGATEAEKRATINVTVPTEFRN